MWWDNTLLRCWQIHGVNLKKKKKEWEDKRQDSSRGRGRNTDTEQEAGRDEHSSVAKVIKNQDHVQEEAVFSSLLLLCFFCCWPSVCVCACMCASVVSCLLCELWLGLSSLS